MQHTIMAYPACWFFFGGLLIIAYPIDMCRMHQSLSHMYLAVSMYPAHMVPSSHIFKRHVSHFYLCARTQHKFAKCSRGYAYSIRDY